MHRSRQIADVCLWPISLKKAAVIRRIGASADAAEGLHSAFMRA